MQGIFLTVYVISDLLLALKLASANFFLTFAKSRISIYLLKKQCFLVKIDKTLKNNKKKLAILSAMMYNITVL